MAITEAEEREQALPIQDEIDMYVSQVNSLEEDLTKAGVKFKRIPDAMPDAEGQKYIKKLRSMHRSFVVPKKRKSNSNKNKGGTIMKKYANGGGVRKAKYNG